MSMLDDILKKIKTLYFRPSNGLLSFFKFTLKSNIEIVFLTFHKFYFNYDRIITVYEINYIKSAFS